MRLTLADAVALMHVVRFIPNDIATPKTLAQPDIHRSLLEMAMRYQGAALAFMAEAGSRCEATPAYSARMVN